MTAKILDPSIYEKARRIVYKQYKTPSAYRSGALVKKYKELGGRYGGKKDDNKGIGVWFREGWEDIGGLDYPVYRPTKRITKDTPLLPSEIDPKNLQEQIRLKQKLREKKNLPPFKSKK